MSGSSSSNSIEINNSNNNLPSIPLIQQLLAPLPSSTSQPLFSSPPTDSHVLRSPPLNRNETIKSNGNGKKQQPTQINYKQQESTGAVELEAELELNNLSKDQLIMMIKSISTELETSKELCNRKEKEFNALRIICIENGIADDEIQRLRENNLDSDDNALYNQADTNTIRKRNGEESNSGEVESILDLEELNEAITENAFDFSQSDFTSDDDSLSRFPKTFPIDTRHPSSKSFDNKTQNRHSSLSSRLFAASTLFSSSTSPTSSTSSLAPPPPPPLSAFFTSTPASSTRSRADSIKSVASSSSVPASVESTSVSSVSKGGGSYGEWIGWKSWSGKSSSAVEKGKKSAGKDVDTESTHSLIQTSELEEEENNVVDQSIASTPEVSTASTVESELLDVTSDSNASPSFSSTPPKFRSPSLLSSTTSPSSSQMLSKPRSPSVNLLSSPQLAPVLPSLSTTSLSPYIAQPHQTSLNTSDDNSNLETKTLETPKSRRTSFQPTLTLFPKLSSLSKYSPFAQPVLANPSPKVLLSSLPSSPVVPSISLPPTITTSSTMELDVIPIEALPPSVKNTTSKRLSSNNSTEVSEPLVDRYGFIYDVRSGMKLLRESRGREERRLAGEKEEIEESVEVSVGEVSLSLEEAVLQNRLDIETQISDLSQSLGLPPPTNTSSSNSLLTNIDSNSNSSSLAPPKQLKLIRTISTESTNTIGTTQSMKRLLNQLTEMHDGVEKVQREAWDTFIRRRQMLLKDQSLNNLDLNSSSSNSNTKKNKKKVKIAKVFNNPLVEVGGGSDEVNGVSVEVDSWSENLVGVAQMGSSWKTGKEDWREFKFLVKRGIPIAHRPKIWAECSGANEVREPGSYQELLTQHQGEKNQCLIQIDMDCHRTFPTNVFFAGNGPGVAKLRNILIAYSGRNPTIGYCQGMNNLAATLLLIYPAEEDAFWVLVCILEKILPSDYYTSQLLVSQADQRVLSSLVTEHLPDVAAHLEELGVQLPAITFGWFLSLFSEAVPVHTLLRIWDLLFVYGTVILFRISFAILQMNSSEILECDSAASLYALMRGMTTHLYSVDKLINVACDDLRTIIKDKEVEALRSIHVDALRSEMELIY